MSLISKRTAIDTITQHIPSLTWQDESDLADRADDPMADLADFALRTCACGVRVDGFYAYVDHLISTFGGESHYAS